MESTSTLNWANLSKVLYGTMGTMLLSFDKEHRLENIVVKVAYNVVAQVL